MWNDVRLAWRHLRLGRGGAVAAVIALTLGIAASTAMFALVDGVLLRPLPVRDQASLAVVWREPRGTNSNHVPFTVANLDALNRSSRTLAGAAGVGWHGAGAMVVEERGEIGSLRLAPVTGTFFDVLGAAPALGRTLARRDDVAGAPRTLVISYGTWQRRYGGAADVIGRQLVMGQPFVIVGVMPRGLDFPRGTEAWVTVAALASIAANDTFKVALGNELDAIVRFRAGLAAVQADEELRALLPRIAPPQFDVPGELRPAFRRFDDAVVGEARSTILALFGAMALVLFVATTNVATLLLMRGEARVPELAVRAALGASSGRLAWQLVLESVLLAATAGILAAPASAALLRVLLSWAPPGLPRLDAVAIDGRVLLFCGAVALMTGVAAALLPTFTILRGQLATRIAGHGRTTADTAARTGRRVLVTAQLALAVTVVATSAMLARSLLQLQGVDPGLDVDRLVVASLAVPQATSSDRARLLRLLNDVVARLEASDPVVAATPINARPFSGVGWSVPAFLAEGQDATRAAANPPLDLEAIHPGYFATFGVQVVRGRPFAPGDREGAPAVAIVSEDVAARTWPGQDPIGHRLKMGDAASKADWLIVVGVVRPTRYRDLTTQRPVLYVPAEQLIVTAQALAIRTTASLADTAAAVGAAVRTVDPAVEVTSVQSLDSLRQEPLARPRFTASLSVSFALAALLLSAFGVFAITAASVHHRRSELRVRMALGATPADVQRLILAEGVSLAAFGTALGLAGAIAAARALTDLLYNVHSTDAASLAAATAVLFLSALLASLIPAVRAGRLNPVAALRED
jgi:putative ABC transport system permease protein